MILKPSAWLLPTWDYAYALECQHRIHQGVKEGHYPDGAILMLSHHPVITLGKHANRELITSLNPMIPICETDRGGQVTVHEPGQVVCYPILPIHKFRLTPKSYVFLLEQVIIRVLQKFGITSHRDPEYPGVWINDQKIAAIGVRIKERISLHGFAFNGFNSLQAFQHIIPCGIFHRGLTSLSALMSVSLTFVELQKLFLDEFALVFGIKEIVICDEESMNQIMAPVKDLRQKIGYITS